MSTIAENGLYPPIIDPYLPAVLKGSDIELPFNISYTSISDIQSVHISITRQSNYHSALNQQNYLRGIYVQNVDFSGDDTDVSVTIPYSILQESEIAYNEYYKVQVRVSDISISNADKTGIKLSQYLENNLDHFSEWSTVCLIKFISNQQIEVLCNDIVLVENTIEDSDENVIEDSNIHLFLKHSNEDTNDNEFLNACQFNIYKLENNELELFFTSPKLYVNRETPNQIFYKMPCFFDNANYKIDCNYETCNLYTGTVSYSFEIRYDQSGWGQQSTVSEVSAVDNVIGKVNISLLPFDENTTIAMGSRFIIRRAADKDDFLVWDEVYTKTLTESILPGSQLSFDDFTVESGILYKYEITYIPPNSTDRYSIVDGPCITLFDHAFLTGESTQLCVKFNPNISSFKINVNDSVVNTYGGQYPYISRNGNTYYRTFSLSGTIAYEMDIQHQFATRSSIYGEWIDVYGTAFVNHYMNQQNDRITQRKFREIVMRYLYNDNPKLFRSTPEGNVLVRLTDVNLTPKTELGRMIYDFSCTATEIGEASVENCKMYQIQDYGD